MNFVSALLSLGKHFVAFAGQLCGPAAAVLAPAAASERGRRNNTQNPRGRKTLEVGGECYNMSLRQILAQGRDESESSNLGGTRTSSDPLEGKSTNLVGVFAAQLDTQASERVGQISLSKKQRLAARGPQRMLAAASRSVPIRSAQFRFAPIRWLDERKELCAVWRHFDSYVASCQFAFALQ